MNLKSELYKFLFWTKFYNLPQCGSASYEMDNSLIEARARLEKFDLPFFDPLIEFLALNIINTWKILHAFPLS